MNMNIQRAEARRQRELAANKKAEAKQNRDQVRTQMVVMIVTVIMINSTLESKIA